MNSVIGAGLPHSVANCRLGESLAGGCAATRATSASSGKSCYCRPPGVVESLEAIHAENWLWCRTSIDTEEVLVVQHH